MILEERKYKFLNQLDTYLENVTVNEEIPGAVVFVGKGKEELFYQEYGYSQIYPKIEQMRKDTLFDIASLTKVISTWPGIMKLIQEKKIQIDQEIINFFGENINEELKKVTIKNLLTHTSGLPERTFLKQFGNNKEEIIHGLLNDELQYPVNTEFVYSNRGFIILGNIIEIVSGMSLDRYVKKNIWEPIGMYDTGYNPERKLNVAATEYIQEKNIVKKGIVHDENAELLGGVAGHAGVFSTALDLSKFCKMVLGNDENSIIYKEMIEDSFNNHTIGMNDSRGLGWRIFNDDNIYKPLVGHLGFTGTSIWIEPDSQVYVILLTNRVHPSRENTNMKGIRNTVKRIVFGNMLL